jgi:hypothetical protein
MAENLDLGKSQGSKRLEMGHRKLVICLLFGTGVTRAKSGPVKQSDKPLPLANSKSSMTNPQSKNPEAPAIASPSDLAKKRQMRPF